jgi:uncharacterized protein
MKMSRYNLVIPNDNETLVYNTFTGSIISGNKDFIKSIKTNNLNPQALKILSDLGTIVPDDMDELEEYKQMHKKWKSGKELAEFNMLITYDCNFACPYCYQGRGEKGEEIHGYKSMTPDMIKKFKDFVKKTVEERESKKMSLVLYGGEPMLMRKECMETTDELADWAYNNGVRFDLQALSNGSLIAPEFINWASDYKMRLQIPVDGDMDQHNKMRFYKKTGKGSFDDISKVLRMFKGTNVETHIRISLTDETYPTMERMLDQLKERDLTHIFTDFCYITAFTEACEGYKDHVLPDAKLFKVMPELWKESHKRGFNLNIRPTPQPLPCSSIADGSYIVDPFGKVYKCWELVGLGEHCVGTLHSDGTMEKNDIYDSVLKRDPTEIEQCRDHVILPSCAGGCVCKSYWKEGTYNASGCGSEHYLLPDKVRLFSEFSGDGKPEYTLGDAKIKLIDGRVEPKMAHCYVLV